MIAVSLISSFLGFNQTKAHDGHTSPISVSQQSTFLHVTQFKFLMDWSSSLFLNEVAQVKGQWPANKKKNAP